MGSIATGRRFNGLKQKKKRYGPNTHVKFSDTKKIPLKRDILSLLSRLEAANLQPADRNTVQKIRDLHSPQGLFRYKPGQLARLNEIAKKYTIKFKN